MYVTHSSYIYISIYVYSFLMTKTNLQHQDILLLASPKLQVHFL